MARVKVELPGQGESWFFISQDETVQKFINDLKYEEDSIDKIEVLRETETGSIAPMPPKAMLFEALEKRQEPVYLRINDMTYKFDMTRDADMTELSLEDTDKWFSEC